MNQTPSLDISTKTRNRTAVQWKMEVTDARNHGSWNQGFNSIYRNPPSHIESRVSEGVGRDGMLRVLAKLKKINSEEVYDLVHL